MQDMGFPPTLSTLVLILATWREGQTPQVRLSPMNLPVLQTPLHKMWCYLCFWPSNKNWGYCNPFLEPRSLLRVWESCWLLYYNGYNWAANRLVKVCGEGMGLEHLSGMFRGSAPCSSFSSPSPDCFSLEAGIGFKIKTLAYLSLYLSRY